jgi:type II secretion system protein I
MGKLTGTRVGGRRGFTLIEVMFAVTIVATAFVSLLTLQSQTVAAHSILRKATIATMIAEDQLERLVLRAQGFDRLIDYNDEFARRYPDYTVNAEIRDVDPMMLPVVALLPENLTLKEVVVEVRWRDGNYDRRYELRHFVTQKLI